jgi:uncharacterized protein (TIGR02996 family)
MSDEAALIQAVRASLHDDLPRLVYADWLEERGDQRHEYLRLECELVRTWGYTTPRLDLFAELETLSKRIDPAWLAQVRRCTTPAPPVDVAAVVPALKKLARTTVRLHPRAGEAPADASKIGGTFLWPAKEEWPHCAEHDCPFVCALQLRKEDVPEVGFKPGTDLFQLLWCPHDHEPGFCPDVEAYWWKRASIRKAAEVPVPPTPAGGELLSILSPCVLHPERIVEYPDPFELDELHYEVEESEVLATTADALNRLVAVGERGPGDAAGLYQDCLSTAHGTKVGGYPDWVQNDEYPRCSCGKTMELLVMFASTEFYGGVWGRWLPIQDREVLKVDFLQQRPVSEPMGVMFGDMGNMYVFHCRNCKARPIRAFMQCS